MPYAALALFATSLGSLVAAFVLQIFDGVDPCILCLFQRIPYGVALVVMAVVLAFSKRPRIVKAGFIVAGFAFLSNVGIAAFHSGIERGWWSATDSCAVTPLDGIDPAKMTTTQLLSTAIGSCEDITFSILGLSLANINVFFCLGLAVFAFCAAFGLKITDGACPLCRMGANAKA